jgi:hypothetical protein
MSLKRRIAKLEDAAGGGGYRFGFHVCYIEGKDAEIDFRKDCPECAAMSEAEYAEYLEYCAWCKHRKSKQVGHIIVEYIDAWQPGGTEELRRE